MFEGSSEAFGERFHVIKAETLRMNKATQDNVNVHNLVFVANAFLDGKVDTTGGT